MIAFGGLALKNGQVSSGGAGIHQMERWLREAKDAGIEFVSVSRMDQVLEAALESMPTPRVAEPAGSPPPAAPDGGGKGAPAATN